MEERLRYILSTVNEWLKFAESKNAALLTADGVAVFGILTALGNANLPHSWMLRYVYFCVSLLAIATIVCLLSFIPQLQVPRLVTRRSPKGEDNLMFYGDIANYNSFGYLKALYARERDKQGTIADPIEEDYAQQIVVNSRIALRKYGYFNVALWLTVLAALSPVFSAAIFIVWKCAKQRSGM